MSLSLNLFLCPSGERMTGQLVDAGTGAVVQFTDYGPRTGGAVPTYKKNGGSSVALPDPAEVDVTGIAPLIHWNFPVGTFAPSDVVTVSAVANTFGGASAFVPALLNRGSVNRVGGTLFPPLPTTRTMRAGLNLQPPGLAGLPFFSCMLRNNTGIHYDGSDPGPPPLNADNLPAFTHYDSYQWHITGSPNSTSDGKPIPSYPVGGTSTLVYSGGAGALLYPIFDTGTVLNFVSQDCGHATENVIKFVADLDGSNAVHSPVFGVVMFGGRDVVPSMDTGRTSHTGTWTTVSGAGGWNGSYRKNDRLSASVWTDTAGHLPAGDWLAYFSWPPLAGNTPNAVFTVKENGAIVAGPITLDQRATPNNAYLRDWNFSAIGYAPGGGLAFTTTGGIITVELHGDTLGDCIADSVQFQLIGDTLGSVPYTPVTEIHLYTPEVDAANPPLFHPAADLAYAGLLSLRTMQMQASMGAAIDYADYATPTQSTYGSGGRNVYYSITKLELYPDLDGYFAVDSSNPPVLVTVASVHGSALPMKHGRYVIFPGGVDLPYVSGGAVNLSFFAAKVQYDPARMASNQFAVASYGHSGTGTINPFFPTDAYLQVNFLSIPWPYYFQRVDSLPDCDAYPCIPLGASQACIEQIARDYVANVRPGRKCYYEGGNEHWNFANGAFPDYHYLFKEAAKAGIGVTEMYCRIVAQGHAWFHAILQAAGRGNELVRCFGAQEDNPGGTGQPILDYCQANNTPIDILLIADYLSYYPYGIAGLGTLQGGLTAAQLADGVEAWQALSGAKDPVMALYKTMIDTFNAATGGHVTLGGYEGGCLWYAAGGGGSIEPGQSINGRYHPQARVTAMGHQAQMQARGFAFSNQYCDTQPPVADVGPYPNSVYGIHLGYGSGPGLGTGLDGLHNNKADILGVPPGNIDLMVAVSTIAGGLRDWNAIPAGSGGSLRSDGDWENSGFETLTGLT